MTKLSYPIIMPVGLQELAQKYAYTYIVQELLRLRHNEEGAKFREGKISKEEWEDFSNNWFKPRSDAVSEDILELRGAIKAACFQFSVDLEAVPKLVRK